MSRSPSLQSKAAGDIIPLWYDWSDEIRELCPTDIIDESHWSTDYGTVAISGNPYFPTISDTITQCFLVGGEPNESAVINHSILTYPTGVKLVKRFPILVTEGPWEPGAIPIVMLPDGLPDVATLAGFIGAMPGNSIWVDVTSAYPHGTLYYACPANSFTADGLTVVNGQLVQWVELHAFNGTGTGVPLARLIATTAPLQGGGDLSADRTLSIALATHTVKGAAPAIAQSGALTSDDGISMAWQGITNAHVSPSANILPNKLSKGAAATTTVLTSDGTNNAFAPLSSILVYPRASHAQNIDGYRWFEYESRGIVQLTTDSAVYGNSILETDYYGDGNIKVSSYPEINVFIELELVTRLAELTGASHYLQGPYRLVYTATMNKLYSGPNTWSIGQDFAENTALRRGPIFDGNTVPISSVNLIQSGANNGNLKFQITWSAFGTAGPLAPPCVYALRILGGGLYAP